MLNVWPNETWMNSIGITIIIIQLFVPLLIITICYGRILCMLSTHISTNLSETTSERISNNEAMRINKFQMARKNTIITLLIVACCFVICWSQNQVLFLMYHLGYKLDWNGVYIHYTVLMVFINCTVNPFVYLAKYHDYQIALQELLPCLPCSQGAAINRKDGAGRSVSTVSENTTDSNEM